MPFCAKIFSGDKKCSLYSTGFAVCTRSNFNYGKTMSIGCIWQSQFISCNTYFSTTIMYLIQIKIHLYLLCVYLLMVSVFYSHNNVIFSGFWLLTKNIGKVKWFIFGSKTTMFNVKMCLDTIVYQLPLILTALLHVALIKVVYLTACAFIRS